MKKKLLVTVLLAVILLIACASCAMAASCNSTYNGATCNGEHTYDMKWNPVRHEKITIHHAEDVSWREITASEEHTMKATVTKKCVNGANRGTSVEKCTVCGYTDTSTQYTHSAEKRVVDVDPTCCSQGGYHMVCADCGITTMSNAYIEPTGEHKVEWRVIDEAANCQSTDVEGKFCGNTNRYLNETRNGKKGDHNLKTVESRPMTCTELSYTRQECTLCGFDVESYGSYYPGHQGKEVQGQAATCGKDGWNKVICKECGTLMVEKSSTIPATGKHSFGKWTTTKAATCTKAGSQERACTVCGKTETKSIAATGKHVFSAWKTVVEPTATANGKAVRVCVGCNAEQEKTLNATGNGGNGENEYPVPAPIDPNHTHVPTTIKGFAATCEDWGREDGTACEICGKIMSGSWIAPTGHTPVTVPGVAATPDAKGWTDGLKCATCGKTLLKQVLVDYEGNCYDPDDPSQIIDRPVYPPVEVEGELIPGHPNFDMDKFLDDYYDHVENGEQIRPTIDEDKCIIGTNVKLEGDNITVLIKGAEDYATCPVDNYPLSQWIDLGNGTHKRICTCIDCNYTQMAACTFFTVVVDEVEYKVCPVCGHFTEKSYEWIKGVKVGGIGDMNSLIARELASPFGTAAVQVKDMSAQPTVVTGSFTAVKSTKGVLDGWLGSETLYIPMVNPGDVTMVQVDLNGAYTVIPFDYENGYLIFDAAQHGLYLFVAE